MSVYMGLGTNWYPCSDSCRICKHYRERLKNLYGYANIAAVVQQVIKRYPYSKPRHSLQRAFSWIDSPQGHDFWGQVNANLGGWDV